MQKQIKQVFHDVRTWEEVAHNMWGDVDDKRCYLELAISFTSNHVEYGLYMRKVAEEWPISCENALTDPHLNHKAWIGHAACALAHGIPEDIVRTAWGYLSDEQKFLANKEAERAVEAWKERYVENSRLRGELGGSMLL